MPYKINKIEVFRDYVKFYHNIKYTLDAEVYFPFVAGEMQDLIPEDAKLGIGEPLVIEQPLFNDAGITKISSTVGMNDVIYLELRPGFSLSKLIVEPEGIVTDLYYNKDKLIYSFYNQTSSQNIQMTAILSKDDDHIHQKLKANPADIILRRHFIRLALQSSKDEIAKIPKEFPEIMDAQLLGDYLLLKKKTIQNMTSEGKLPTLRISGSVRYSKEEIDVHLRKHRTGRRKNF